MVFSRGSWGARAIRGGHSMSTTSELDTSEVLHTTAHVMELGYMWHVMQPDCMGVPHTPQLLSILLQPSVQMHAARCNPAGLQAKGLENMLTAAAAAAAAAAWRRTGRRSDMMASSRVARSAARDRSGADPRHECAGRWLAW